MTGMISMFAKRVTVATTPWCVMIVCGGCSTSAEADRITDVLHRQARAWNNGDVVGFMDHYLRSDELTFSSGGRTVRGWQATLDRYRRRYPDRAAMGELRFSDLEISVLSRDAALVLGRWHLHRDDGDVGGNFSLVFVKSGGRWLIRHDHTSRDRNAE